MLAENFAMLEYELQRKDELDASAASGASTRAAMVLATELGDVRR